MKFNKKMIIMLASVVGVILVVIIVMMLFAGGKSKVLDYAAIEDKIVSAGQNYYADHEDELPKSGTITIEVDKLISEGYLNELSTYTEDDVICDGILYVTKNPSNYSYRANLSCNDYNTKTFKDIIVSDVVTSGSGLYKESQVNPNNNEEKQTVYVFKGDNVNNYIKVGDFYWQIIKVYENGEVVVLGDPSLLRATWDNRFNIEEEGYRGINDYSVSRMKDSIEEEVVNDKDGYLLIKSLITTHTACVGNRYLDDTSRDGESECSKTLENQYFSLLPVYDYMNASLDENCNSALDESCYNYNYLTMLTDEWWTVTGVADNTSEVYFMDGTLENEYANVTQGVRLYAHLDANVKYISGTGTYEDPYVIE